MTEWIYRLHVIVPATDRDAANEMAATLGPDHEGEFSDPTLSVGGVYPATHIIVNGSARQSDLDDYIAILPQWETYGLSAPPQFWTCDALTGELLNSNVSAASIGQTWLTWPGDTAATCAAAGLAWTVFPGE